MFALSLGLGFPYLLLATFSNLLGSLPRSGEWMDWVKKLFGMLLRDRARRTCCSGVAPTQASWLLPTALLLGGLYLGFMEKSGNRLAGFRRVQERAVGALARSSRASSLMLQMTAAHVASRSRSGRTTRRR